MQHPRHWFVLLPILIGINVCLYGQTTHNTKRVIGSTGNKLEVLDWGGTGSAILFLSGLSNSAHVYDSFAPRFTNNFHVYGMSRRGYGASEQTSSGYGIDTLTNDILSVIDHLGLDKVILIGHSLAGDEMTIFASQHPGRVLKIIYLDAAYNHSNLKLPFPDFPKGMGKDSLTIQDLNKDLKKLRGFLYPEDELRQQFIFSPKGFRVKSATSPAIAGTIVRGLRLQDYKAMKAPALAIYGQRNTAQQYFASFPYMDSTQQQKAANIFMPAWKTYYKAEIERFKMEKPDGIVKEIPGADHYVFLTNPDETENLIKEFLK